MEAGLGDRIDVDDLDARHELRLLSRDQDVSRKPVETMQVVGPQTLRRQEPDVDVLAREMKSRSRRLTSAAVASKPPCWLPCTTAPCAMPTYG